MKPITLTYAQIDSNDFSTALNKLRTHPFTSQKTAYNIAKIWRKMKPELETCQELYMKLLKQYAKLDENGAIAWKDGVQGKLDIADVAGYQKALTEFRAVEFTIPCDPIPLEQLDGAGLTADEMLAAEALIDVADKPEFTVVDAAAGAR